MEFPHLREWCDELGIDYLGVSLDALLIIAPPEYAMRFLGA